MRYRNLSFAVAFLAAVAWAGVALHEHAAASPARLAALSDCEKHELRLATNNLASGTYTVTNRIVRRLKTMCAAREPATTSGPH